MSLKLPKEGANNLERKAGKKKKKQYSISQSTCTLEEIDITMYWYTKLLKKWDQPWVEDKWSLTK